MSPYVDDVLARIVEATQERLAREPARVGLEERAREAAGVRRRAGRRSLLAALSEPGVRVIAECKRRSPSKGVLSQALDPVALARAYQAGGAAAISVVTEPRFFDGHAEWVRTVRAATALPVLQKDFFFSARQLHEAALIGADAILLIARILPGSALRELQGLAGELGFDTLVEVHDRRDLERAVAAGARLIGVNSRDLQSFSVNLEAAAALAAEVPADRVAVVESGIGGRSDVERALAFGLRRFLVGEHLVRSGDPRAAVAELVGQ